MWHVYFNTMGFNFILFNCNVMTHKVTYVDHGVFKLKHTPQRSSSRIKKEKTLRTAVCVFTKCLPPFLSFFLGEEGNKEPQKELPTKELISQLKHQTRVFALLCATP